MKKSILILVLTVCRFTGIAQPWQQTCNFRIDVKLNPSENTLDGFVQMQYSNHSPDTLRFIWIHLWPNAYKNDRTAFSDQLLENGETDFYFSGKEQRGYINKLSFQVNGITAQTEDHPEFIDAVKLILPKQLVPQDSIYITTPFHEKLPFNFSRGGYDHGAYQVTQWYPKPAVYDSRGWHVMPYLDQGEFYSDFGDYTIRITVPEKYIIAATGKEITTANDAATFFTSAFTQNKYVIEHSLPGSTQTITYHQDQVHDFAWFTDKNFIRDHDTCMLASGKIIEVSSYYTPAQKEYWKESISNIKETLRFYSTEVGEYPYNTLKVVQGPHSFGGGMEYPCITLISPVSDKRELEELIVHEVGHNWFQGILASNERQFPWMDEGITTFYEEKFLLAKYTKLLRYEALLFQTKVFNKTDQPINLSSEKYSVTNYNLSVYYKTAKWLRTIEGIIGTDSFRHMMQQYYTTWKFSHPYPEDFKEILGLATEKGDSLFAQLQLNGLLPVKKNKAFSLVSPLVIPSVYNYLYHPSRTALVVSPAAGYNSYDGVMAGIILSNYKLPPSRFMYLVAPLYGTQSKNLSLLSRANYRITGYGKIRAADFFLNYERFSNESYNDNGFNKYLHFEKMVPGIKLTFRAHDARSTTSSYLQFKSFFIREQQINYRNDTIFQGADTLYKLSVIPASHSYHINRLDFIHENFRAIYPYKIWLQIDQSADFIRPTLTGNYYFNYADGGGLDIRAFAGKFIYLQGATLLKQFQDDRYFLNLTGANGYEDYTYSNYFIGRNNFGGLPSQQIMMRDGGFKIRTDLLAEKIGKTDDWLASVNFTSSLPRKIDPFKTISNSVSLKVFIDAGTYAGVWNNPGSAGRFLYDAGLELSLFAESIHIYVPVLYSKVYRDYVNSTITGSKLLHTISFSIDLYNPFFKKINRETEF